MSFTTIQLSLFGTVLVQIYQFLDEPCCSVLKPNIFILTRLKTRLAVTPMTKLVTAVFSAAQHVVARQWTDVVNIDATHLVTLVLSTCSFLKYYIYI